MLIDAINTAINTVAYLAASFTNEVDFSRLVRICTISLDGKQSILEKLSLTASGFWPGVGKNSHIPKVSNEDFQITNEFRFAFNKLNNRSKAETMLTRSPGLRFHTGCPIAFNSKGQESFDAINILAYQIFTLYRRLEHLEIDFKQLQTLADKKY